MKIFNKNGLPYSMRVLFMHITFTYFILFGVLCIVHRHCSNVSMLSPTEGTPGICGAFDLYCLPHPREFD